MPEIMLSTKEAADLLGVSPDILHSWRHRGIGPKFHRYERTIRYAKSDIEAYRDSAKVETDSHSYSKRFSG